jgi:PAB-dependent poly(A)-specific ribonuclease subunit 3
MLSAPADPDVRKTMASPRAKNRGKSPRSRTVHDRRLTQDAPENAKNTPCRNIPIYGFCRYEKDGCAYNHDMTTSKSGSRPITAASSSLDSASKFNVESPSFTPLQPHVNGTRRSREYPTISPRSANATPFTPRNAANEANISAQYAEPKEDLKRVVMGSKEFHPASFEPEQTMAQDVNDPSLLSAYDPYTLQTAYQGLATQQQPAIHNPYLQDPYSNPNYYQTMQSFSAPLQHHLYAPLPPHRENLHGYQRMTHDFFIPEDLRRDFQKRMEATLQVMPSKYTLQSCNY